LKATVREHGRGSAAEVLEKIFATAYHFGHERAWEDDATIVVVRRLPVEAAPPSA
jgi:serine phosphatase RsbU (regulator of sigma subunit)